MRKIAVCYQVSRCRTSPLFEIWHVSSFEARADTLRLWPNQSCLALHSNISELITPTEEVRPSITTGENLLLKVVSLRIIFLIPGFNLCFQILWLPRRGFCTCCTWCRYCSGLCLWAAGTSTMVVKHSNRDSMDQLNRAVPTG